MTVKRLKQLPLYLIFSLCSLFVILTGCSGKQDEKKLLDTLPANPSLIAAANLNTVFKQASCKLNEKQEYILSDAVQIMLEGQDLPTATLVNVMADLASVANLDDVIWYVPQGKQLPIVTFTIYNRKDFEKKVSEKAIATAATGEYIISTYPELVVVNNSKQCWISRQADYIFDALETASTKTFDSTSLAYDFLQKNNDIRIVVNFEEAKDYGIDNLAYTIDLKNNGIFATMYGITSENTYKNIKGAIDNIDTDFMDYVPSKAAVIGAIGKINSISEYMGMVNDMMEKQPMEVNLVYQMIADYMHMIDGTTAVALKPVAGSQAVMKISLSTWDFMFFTSMPADESDALIETINTYAPLGGIKVNRLENGFYQARRNNDTYLFGAKDGNFILANYDLNSVSNPIESKMFEGKMAALKINVPYNSELMKGAALVYGLDIDVTLSEESLNVVIKFPGANTTPFTALIEQYNAFND